MPKPGRAACKQSEIRAFIVRRYLFRCDVRNVAFEEGGRIVGLERIPATWVDVQSRGNVNTATYQAVRQPADTTE